MRYRIKNWEKFQHYKTGRGAPPWIKLYRDLLNDPEWFELDPVAAKFLVSLWILAAEMDGDLPDSKTIAFRLRIDSNLLAKLLSDCSHWIITVDSSLLATCKQLATPEVETETDKEKDPPSQKPRRRLPEADEQFLTFWTGYPRKEGKKDAIRSWGKLTDEKKTRAINDSKTRYSNTDPKYIPMPATYLNGERFEDVTGSKSEEWVNT